MKNDGLRILGWIIPILCMAVAGWILYGQNQAFTETSNQANQANREIQQAEKERELYKSLKTSSKYAADDDVPSEETFFLNYLRACCDRNHVLTDRFQTTTVVYGKDKQATPADPATAALLKGIRKVSSTFTFVGEYPNVRKLLGELEASDRLYTLTNISWALAKDGTSTSLSVTLSRYVAPPDPHKAAEPVKPGGAKPGSPATVNSSAPLSLGASSSSAPPAGPAGQIKPVTPLKSQPTIKPSPATPGVTSKP